MAAVMAAQLALVASLGAGSSVMAAEPVRIGATISQSGAFARAARPMLTAYRLAEKITNEEGGLLGRPVQLVVYDDQSDPARAVSLYRRLITQDQVDLLLGPFSSSITFAVAPLVESYRYPTLAPQAADPNIWAPGRKYLFGLLPSNAIYLTGAVDLAASVGVQRIAVIHQESAAPIAVAQGVLRRAREKGLQVVLQESYPVGATEFTALMARVRNSGAQAVIGGGYVDDEIALTLAAKAVGYQPMIMAWQIGAADPNFYRSLGRDAEGVMGNTQWEPSFTTPGNREFVERYTREYGEEPYYDTAASFAAFRLLVQAVREVGRLDREAIRNYLANAKLLTVFGEYEVNEKGMQIGKQVAIFQWQNGKRVIVWPPDLAQAKPVVPKPAWQ